MNKLFTEVWVRLRESRKHGDTSRTSNIKKPYDPFTWMFREESGYQNLERTEAVQEGLLRNGLTLGRRMQPLIKLQSTWKEKGEKVLGLYFLPPSHFLGCSLAKPNGNLEDKGTSDADQSPPVVQTRLGLDRHKWKQSSWNLKSNSFYFPNQLLFKISLILLMLFCFTTEERQTRLFRDNLGGNFQGYLSGFLLFMSPVMRLTSWDSLVLGRHYR